MFRTHQERLPRELLLAGITDMAQANHYLKNVYLPAFNADSCSRLEKRATLVLWIGGDLDDILCEGFERTVGNDNCVRFDNVVLQIPPDCYRCHYVGAKVRVNRYSDGHLAVLHGPHKLAEYDSIGQLLKPGKSRLWRKSAAIVTGERSPKHKASYTGQKRIGAPNLLTFPPARPAPPPCLRPVNSRPYSKAPFDLPLSEMSMR